MNIYIIKSLKWSGTPNYSNKIVYWGENSSGYTNDINRAGLYTEEQIMNKPHYFNNGNTTEAILVDSKAISDEELEQMQLGLEIEKNSLIDKESHYKELKKNIKDLEVEMKNIGSSIVKQEQEIRIQTMLKQ